MSLPKNLVMLVLLFACAVLATAVPVGMVLTAVLHRRCRFRCNCVDDSLALGALASVAHKAKVRDGRT